MSAATRSRATPSWGAADQARSIPAGPAPRSGVAAASRRAQRRADDGLGLAGAPAGGAEGRQQRRGRRSRAGSPPKPAAPTARAWRARSVRISVRRRDDAGRDAARPASPRRGPRRPRAGSRRGPWRRRRSGSRRRRPPGPRPGRPSPSSTPAPSSAGPVDRRLRSSGSAAHTPSADLGRAGLDRDRAEQRVEVALPQLVEVADVVPVAVDLVRVEGDVALEQGREHVHRPVGEAGRVVRRGGLAGAGLGEVVEDRPSGTCRCRSWRGRRAPRPAAGFSWNPWMRPSSPVIATPNWLVSATRLVARVAIPSWDSWNSAIALRSMSVSASPEMTRNESPRNPAALRTPPEVPSSCSSRL